MKGDQFLSDDDPARAAKEYEAVIQSDPGVAQAHEGAARAWLAAGELKKAVAAGQAGEGKFPGNPGILTLLGRAHLASGNPVDALAAAEKALAARGAPAAAWRVKAEATAALAPADGAAAGDKVLVDALAANPGNGLLWEEAADYLLVRGRAADALPRCRKAVELDPARVEARVLLVRGLLGTKDIPAAREAAQAAVDLAPGSAEARNIMGRTFEEAGEPAGALPAYQEAVRLRPRRASFQVDLGYALGLLKRWKDAEKVLLGAVKLDEGNLEARFHLGWVFNRTGELPRALEQYQWILKSHPENRRALWNGADLAAILGKTKDAQQFLDRLLAVDSRNSEAYRLLAFLHFRNGKYEEALKALGQCLDLDPKNARGLFLQGQLQEDGGTFEDAEKSYLAAVEADPKLSWPHLYLAELYDEVFSKPVEALKAFRRYLELGGPDEDGSVQRAVDALAKETGK